MPHVLRTGEAEEDLIKIWLDIAQDNPAAADKLLLRIDEKFILLAGNPKLGRALPEPREGMRRWPIGQYLFLYREISGGVEIVRVIPNPAKSFRDVIARRQSRRGDPEATALPWAFFALDCFASLAMRRTNQPDLVSSMVSAISNARCEIKRG